MSINLHILRASGRLEPFVDQIQKEFDETVNKISKTMPLQEIDVVIQDNPRKAIPEIGVGGSTIFSYLIEISIDPNFPNLINLIGLQIRETLAHELAHAFRWGTLEYNGTLLESLISEGLADHFEMEINNTLPKSWDKALDKEQLNNLLNLAKKQYFSEDYIYSDWFFGSKDGKIPRWTGYSLGFYLVDEYLKKHPDQKASTLYNVKAEEFLK